MMSPRQRCPGIRHFRDFAVTLAPLPSSGAAQPLAGSVKEFLKTCQLARSPVGDVISSWSPTSVSL